MKMCLLPLDIQHVITRGEKLVRLALQYRKGAGVWGGGGGGGVEGETKLYQKNFNKK